MSKTSTNLSEHPVIMQNFEEKVLMNSNCNQFVKILCVKLLHCTIISAIAILQLAIAILISAIISVIL